MDLNLFEQSGESSRLFKMNTTQKSDLIDEMIAELDRARIAKQTQVGYIADISEKSNNILLHIEASQKAKVAQDDATAVRSKYCKEILHTLAKTVEIFERLINKNTEQHQTSGDFEKYITSTKVKVDFLGSAVRKLLALNDTVNHIGSELHNDSDDFELDSTDTGDENSIE